MALGFVSLTIWRSPLGLIQQLGLAKKILIVDLDVHQGDGTALIFQNDASVFTFSMHCEVNFPGTKQMSDRDVALPEGMADEAYLQTLAAHLPDLLAQVKPDLVLYDAGVDVHLDDRLGKLALSDRGGFLPRNAGVGNLCKSGLSGGLCDWWWLCRRHQGIGVSPFAAASGG